MTDPSRRLGPVVRLAPAKLNLTLAVVGRRPDGYHGLHSVMVPLALADRLSVAPAAAGEETVHVVGGVVDWPPDRDLVRRAISTARIAVGRLGPWGSGPAPALAVRLEKRIPVAAGLGGGSSDAAAAIDAALEAWGVEPDPEVRLASAVAVGSDVPFFLAGGPALVEGRGEAVEPLPAIAGGPPGILLVTPGLRVSTASVFAAFDELRAFGPPVPAGDPAIRLTSEHLAAELRQGLTAIRLVDRSGVLAVANDLAAATAVLEPALPTFRRRLFRFLGRPVGQSGSGPTLWALYPSLDAAEAAAALVADALARGDLEPPGADRPTVHATTPLPGGPDR